MATVEHCTFRFNKRVAPSLTAVASCALLSAIKLDDLAKTDLAVIETILVPAKGTGRNQSRVFHLLPTPS